MLTSPQIRPPAKERLRNVVTSESTGSLAGQKRDTEEKKYRPVVPECSGLGEERDYCTRALRFLARRARGSEAAVG